MRLKKERVYTLEADDELMVIVNEGDVALMTGWTGPSAKRGFCIEFTRDFMPIIEELLAALQALPETEAEKEVWDA